MRRSRLILLTLLPAYGLLTLPLTDVIPQASAVLLMSNPAVVMIMFLLDAFRVDLRLTPLILVASNLAFWLPVAHLVDAVLERARRRRAGRGR